jgi:hypothetical protein
MDKLPATLQFLPPTKQREKDTVLRMMCVEILLLLATSESQCARWMSLTRAAFTGRETLRQRGAYYVVRELHKVETDQAVSLALSGHAADYTRSRTRSSVLSAFCSEMKAGTRKATMWTSWSRRRRTQPERWTSSRCKA